MSNVQKKVVYWKIAGILTSVIAKKNIFSVTSKPWSQNPIIQTSHPKKLFLIRISSEKLPSKTNKKHLTVAHPSTSITNPTKKEEKKHNQKYPPRVRVDQ